MNSPSLGHFNRWQEFRYDQIFDIKKGSRLTKADMTEGETPFIGASDARNGVTAYISKQPDHPANVITVAYNGSVAEAFYQPLPFCATDDINVLYPKFSIDQYSGLFIATVIKKEKYRFNYGRKWHKERMEQSTILLPVDDNGQPDTKGMANLILSLNENRHIEDEVKQAEKAESTNRLTIDTTSWVQFQLADLFTIKGSTTTSLLELEAHGSGVYPYVTTQATDNGVAGMYDFYTEEGGVLTVDSAVIGYCSYQSQDFSASDHVEKLIPKFNLNKYIAQFLTAVLNLEQYRYNYGRKASQNRLKLAVIKLPATDDGAPDWTFMEAYIKSLPYSASV